MINNLHFFPVYAISKAPFFQPPQPKLPQIQKSDSFTVKITNAENKEIELTFNKIIDLFPDNFSKGILGTKINKDGKLDIVDENLGDFSNNKTLIKKSDGSYVTIPDRLIDEKKTREAENETIRDPKKWGDSNFVYEKYRTLRRDINEPEPETDQSSNNTDFFTVKKDVNASGTDQPSFKPAIRPVTRYRNVKITIDTKKTADVPEATTANQLNLR